MKLPVNQQTNAKSLPVLSNQSQEGKNVLVNQFRYAPGEATCYFEHEHAIYMSLAPSPVRFLHIKEGKTYTGFCKKGSIAIAPARTPFFARWHAENPFLEIQIPSSFMERVAQETLNQDSNSPELLLGFRIHDPQLEAIALLFID